MKYSSLSAQLPYWHFDENTLVLADGSLGVGILLGGADISCKTDDEINQINLALDNLYLTLPEGYRVQLDFQTSSEEVHFAEHECLQSEDSESLLKFKEARLKHFEKRKSEGQVVAKQSRLYLRSSSFSYEMAQKFKSQKAFRQISSLAYQSHKENFLREVEQVIEHLEATGLSPTLMASQEFFKQIYAYFNPGREAPELPGKTLESPSLLEKIVASDLFVEDEGVRINNYLSRQISMTCLPDGSTFSGMIKRLQNLNIPYRMALSILVPNQQLARQRLGLRRRIAFSMAVGGSGVADLESSNSYTEIEDLLTQIISGRSRLMQMSLTVQLSLKDHRELSRQTDLVLRSFRELGGAEGIVETLPAAQIFFHCAPGVCIGMRDKTLKSSNLAHLSPIYSPWAGNKKQVCLLQTEEDTLFGLDPFDPNLPNWNAVVFGSSGSGKSFCVSQLMLQTLSQKNPPRVVWLDNGASSKNLAIALGGSFIDLRLDSGHRINMFDTGGSAPTPSKINLILAVLEQILKEPQQPSLPRSDKATIEQVLGRLYRESPTPTLSDFREALKQSPGMQTYYNILYSWTGSSRYGKLLDGPTNISLDHDITSIELGSLSTVPDLKNILLLMVTGMTQDFATKDRTRPYLCIVDEAERLFQTELAREFVITCFRTWRKYGSGIWALSQNYKDFLRDENLKDSLLPNTSMMFILEQRNIDWQDFQKALSLNENAVEKIRALRTRKRSHSDLFFSQVDKQAILKLDPDPLSYKVCTTDPNDLKEES